MSRSCSRPSRPAFTLIELMVVILIIAVLVSLISSAAMRTLNKIPQVRTSTEIAQLTIALEGFMMDHGLTDPPPSQLLLYENVAGYKSDPSPLAQQSYLFLQRAFGKNVGLGVPYIDWNGDTLPNGPWYLEGEQCLVFYCGGIPSALGMQGFSSSGINPAAPGGKRLGPYYNFEVPRLTLLPGLAPFPAYIDPWQSKRSSKPYAYFSSRGYSNGYANTGNAFLLVDCAGIGASPYAESYLLGAPDATMNAAITYMNRNGFQIISAGKDGVFGQSQNSAGLYGFTPADWSSTSGGPYGPWPPVPTLALPAIPSFNASLAPAANDDQSNFSSSLLGVPQS